MRFSLHAFSRLPRLRRHCSHAELVAFQCASLDEAAARRAALHVSSCPRCSSELRLIRADIDSVERSLAVAQPLAAVAADDWPRLLRALHSYSRRRLSPDILAPYLGDFAHSAASSGPGAVEVLQTLLGAHAAAAVSAELIDEPEDPKTSV